ncbi:MAG: hypothetical protein GTO40_01185 [Deltaproteobacteria bacterium]|nr:hypothetical protein [Deltaproteobacteria bacterium]
MVGRILFWFVEHFKSFTDTMLLLLLRATSWFGYELTEEGKREHQEWREQRLRSIRGLGLISLRRQQRQHAQESAPGEEQTNAGGAG